MSVSLAHALSSLYARVPLGMRLGLDAMREACRETGHPERAFPVVHVAGTNGKGSVSAMVESVARASGKRTGLFTSPHLSRFAERIAIDGAPLDDTALAALLEDALRRGAGLSFFETATLAAFLAFRDAHVDIAVIEVGLGGRLDATNVVEAPVAAAITRIAKDHTDRLGLTLVEIAREKAGIAKPGLDIVLGPVSREVRGAIDAVARASGGTTSAADDDAEAVAFGNSRGASQVGLAGAHQRDNARVAYVLGRRTGADVSACEEGVARVRWPARLETIDTPDGPVLLDAAHNPDGARALSEHVDSLGVPRERMALVFGVLADKAWTEMLDLLAGSIPQRFYVTRFHDSPAGRATVPAAVLAQRHNGHPNECVADAIARARAAIGGGGLVVVTGSILIVGEARSILLGLPRDPAVAM